LSEEVLFEIVKCDNKIYWVNEVGEGIRYLVAAKNRNQAKLLSLLYNDGDVPYIELEARVAREKDGKPVKTHLQGELGGAEIIKHGLAWWECPSCNGTHFAPWGSDEFVCMVCGHREDIPFVD
jgi:hypothetical protein